MFARTLMTLTFAASLSASPLRAGPKPDRLDHRWVYVQTNLQVDKNVEQALAVFRRAAQAGYNGVVLTDSKFMRWDQVIDRYFHNVRTIREACRDLRLQCIAGVCPIGYSNDLLARDPNLAEGLPVMDAPFVARGGTLVPADESVQVINGGFEQHRGHRPTGWDFVDQPGTMSFIDTEVRYEGGASLRLEDIGRHDPQHGNGRACQKIAVKPFHYYHVSVAVKTRDFESAGDVRIAVLAKDGRGLNFHQPRIDRTQDWRRIDVTFNSLDASEVRLYLGVWGGRRGTIWWDDLRIEPAGLVNVVRRDGAPLRATSEDGRTVYVEGQDFLGAKDPKLGTVPYPGGFSAWHEPPNVMIPAGSRIHDGQKVLLSYYHTAIIYQDQVMCCMAAPKVYEILRWQLAEVHKHLAPDGYFLSHDEIRVQGWDASCQTSRRTPGQLLAENVKRCVGMVRREDPGKPIYVWSDMFDPHHNARPTGAYYLVKGDGPWQGSWEGLDRDVVIVNWNSGSERGASLEHFAGRGHRQILAGYYDGPVEAIGPWLRDARRVGGVVGVMYTTWRQGYGDLEAFAEELRKP